MNSVTLSSPISRRLILVGGHAGSGKTVIGEVLARNLGVLIDKDTVSRYFTERLLQELGCDKDDRESPTYISEVRDLEYRTMMHHAEENLSLGNSVVCAAPFVSEFMSPSWVNECEVMASLCGARLERIWVHSDDSSALHRLTARGASRDKWKLSNWTEYLARTPHETPCFSSTRKNGSVTILDNSIDAEVSVAQSILDYLESLPAVGNHDV